jgi:hypothetical protein
VTIRAGGDWSREWLKQLNRQICPGRLPAISRGLSKAIPPELSPIEPHPEGVPAAMKPLLCDPSGVRLCLRFRGCRRGAPQPPANGWHRSAMRTPAHVGLDNPRPTNRLTQRREDAKAGRGRGLLCAFAPLREFHSSLQGHTNSRACGVISIDGLLRPTACTRQKPLRLTAPSWLRAGSGPP